MMSKKKIAVTVLSLLLAQQSFSTETEGLYFSGSYYGQYLNYVGELKAKIVEDTTSTDINGIFINDRGAQNTKGQLLSKYKASYNPPFAANVALGYIKEWNDNGYRAEVEGIYSSVKVDNIGLINGQMTISYIRDETKPEEKYGAILDHHQIDNISVMINVYRNWKSDSLSFSPYIGIGVGTTRMSMFNKSSIRPAGQLKAGLDYRVNRDVNMYIGYRGFYAIGRSKYKFETLKLDPTFNNGSDKPKGLVAKKMEENPIFTTIENRLFHTHGVEAGLTFRFTSKA